MEEKLGPQVIRRCRKCGAILDEWLITQAAEYHVGCDPETELQDRNAVLKEQVIELVTFVDDNSSRSKQQMIGPSELGNDCDQFIARKLAGMPEINKRHDKWPAIVGTGVHAWLEKAVAYYNEAVYDEDLRHWKTEVTVQIDDMIEGHTDVWTGLDVLDWKTASPDRLRKYRTQGVPEKYRVQAHLYGRGHAAAGRRVRDVVLVFLPRSGFLKDMYIWREPYNEDVAYDALERMYRIGNETIIAGLPESGNWAEIAIKPGPDCYMCPFFIERASDAGPDTQGCPGNSGTAADRASSSKARATKGLL